LQPLSYQQNLSYSAPGTRRLSLPQSHSQFSWGVSGKEVPKVSRGLLVTKFDSFNCEAKLAKEAQSSMIWGFTKAMDKMAKGLV
jgi:hypothetical protein